MQPPQGVNAKVILDDAKTRSQKESSQDEPSFLVGHRVSSAVQPLVQGRPEGAQQGSVPSALRRPEDALQALEDRADGYLVLFASGTGEYDLDLLACRFQCVRRGSWG